MELFHGGGEAQKSEQRRLIEEKLLPPADEALDIIDNLKSLPIVSGREAVLRRSRDALTEQMNELVGRALNDRVLNVAELADRQNMLSQTQHQLLSMRANVIRDVGLKPVVGRLRELLEENERYTEAYYRHRPPDHVFAVVESVLDAQFAVWGILREAAYIEDDPHHQINAIYIYLNNLRIAENPQESLRFLARNIDALHAMISERDWRISEPLRQGSYQNALDSACEKLRQSVAQLRENL